MKINCLSCGFSIVLDDSYSDYEGAIKCYACETTLEVKLVEGNVKAVKLQAQIQHAAPAGKSKTKS